MVAPFGPRWRSMRVARLAEPRLREDGEVPPHQLHVAGGSHLGVDAVGFAELALATLVVAEHPSELWTAGRAVSILRI